MRPNEDSSYCRATSAPAGKRARCVQRTGSFVMMPSASFSLGAKRMRDPRLEKLAHVLVNYSVGVKRDQLCRISTAPLAAPLVAELVRAIVKAGGHPFVRMSPEELGEILVKHGSDEQLKF